MSGTSPRTKSAWCTNDRIRLRQADRITALPYLQQALGEGLQCDSCQVSKWYARLDGVNRCLLRIQHNLINLALLVGEFTVSGERSYNAIGQLVRAKNRCTYGWYQCRNLRTRRQHRRARDLRLELDVCWRNNAKLLSSHHYRQLTSTRVDEGCTKLMILPNLENSNAYPQYEMLYKNKDSSSYSHIWGLTLSIKVLCASLSTTDERYCQIRKYAKTDLPANGGHILH